MSNIIVYSVNKENGFKFCEKYPKIKSLILSQKWKGKNFLKQYCSFINYVNSISVSEFCKANGAEYETVSSETFGTKDFMRLDWCGLGGWAELYQYLLKS